MLQTFLANLKASDTNIRALRAQRRDIDLNLLQATTTDEMSLLLTSATTLITQIDDESCGADAMKDMLNQTIKNIEEKMARLVQADWFSRAPACGS